MVQNLPADAEDGRDVGLISGSQEDSLEGGMVTYPSILARNPVDRGT